MEIQEILQNLDFSSIAWQILAPCIFSLCDVLTGFIQAVINKDVDSQVMRTGLLHKVLIIIVILLSFVADISLNLNFVSKIVCGYVMLMETTSILENLKKAGVDIGKLTEILKNK
jgi:toxin secretion/phage lysis holin